MAAPIPPTAAEASVAVGGADKIKRAALDFPPVATSASSRLVRFAGGDGVEGAWTVTGLFPMIPYILNLPCTMTIYRAADGNLVLFNALRVPEEMEDEILELGPIKHIVKTGQFHGAADAYWTLHEKFGRPKYWAMPGASIAEVSSEPNAFLAVVYTSKRNSNSAFAFFVCL